MSEQLRSRKQLVIDSLAKIEYKSEVTINGVINLDINLDDIIKTLTEGARLIDNPLIIAELHKYCYLAEILVPDISMIDNPEVGLVIDFYRQLIKLNINPLISLIVKNYLYEESAILAKGPTLPIVVYTQEMRDITYFATILRPILELCCIDTNDEQLISEWSQLSIDLGNGYKSGLPEYLDYYLRQSWLLIRIRGVIGPSINMRCCLVCAVNGLLISYGIKTISE